MGLDKSNDYHFVYHNRVIKPALVGLAGPWISGDAVPTSYMAFHSDFDFVGCYDHGKHAGMMHVANHQLLPGKKQWTWGSTGLGEYAAAEVHFDEVIKMDVNHLGTVLHRQLLHGEMLVASRTCGKGSE